jgi:alcohol dehydrogenase
MAAQAFDSVKRIVFGDGSLDKLPEEIQRLKFRKVLVVTDPGIKAAGLLDRVLEKLGQSGAEFQVFSDVQPDPEIGVVFAGCETAKSFAPDAILGLGGGSSLDISKAISLMLANSGPIDLYFGMELVPKPGVPTILIPTTAGTGSEMTSISILSDKTNQSKKGIVSRHLYAHVALLDPQLTVSMPPAVTAMTGMDALVHAIESYVGVRASVFTETPCLKAIELIGSNLRRAFANGEDIEARSNMLYASSLAGMGFANTQTGLDHAIAMGIGGRHHLPHGLTTAAVLPWVMEFNLLANPRKFAQIANAMGENIDGLSEREAAKRSVLAAKSLLDDLRISYRVRDYGVSTQEFPAVAQAAIKAARLITNNPRRVTEKEIVMLLESNY